MWPAALLTLGLAVLMLPGSGLAQGQEQKPGTLRIVALGDSLTAGYGVAATEAFPVQLEAALRARGHDVIVENAGVSGDTTSQGLARLDWSVPPGTDAVILELGANDMLRGLPPQVPRDALDKMLTRLKARDLPVLLAGMLAAPNLGPQYRMQFDVIYPELSANHGTLLYPFFFEGIAGKAEFFQKDGLHPNASGVARIVENILPSVEQLIAVTRKAQAEKVSNEPQAEPAPTKPAP